MTTPKKPLPTVILAGFFTLLLLLTGYFSFGPWTTFIFASGFLGGYIMWLAVPDQSSWKDIRAPYLLSMATFIFLHRVEEYFTKFQEELSKITLTQTPELTSPALILLVLASIGGWLIAPWLIKKGYAFGYYLGWTFFASMGITELAHFVFPLLKSDTYDYFPGMASVVVLAPLAWWGIRRMVTRKTVRLS